MKILNICVNFPYTDNFTYQDNLLSKSYKIFGADVYVLAPNYEIDSNGKVVITKKNNYIDNNGLKIIRLPLKNYHKRNSPFKRFNGFYEAICEIKPDIIFCHLFQFIDIIDVIKYKKEHPNVKLYADNHADLNNSARNWISKNILHKIIWKYYSHKLYPYVEKFYGVLPVRVDFLKDMYNLPKEKCELLIMGVDDEQVKRIKENNIREKVREKYKIKDNDFLIVTGGKIDKKKKTLELLKAIKKINNPKIKFIFFGSIIDELKEEILSLCDENIIYLGWLDSNQSCDIFASADLVVFPGLHSVFWEQVAGLGIPMLLHKLPGVDHLDNNGNIKYIENVTIENLYNSIFDIVNNKKEYDNMKYIALNTMSKFSYLNIAKESLK